jgi:deoxyribose-phosphate aldolase
MNKTDIAKLIDHTLLMPDVKEADIIKLCEEVEEYGFYSACIHPSFVRFVRNRFTNSDIRISTVIGFPLGMTLKRVKVYEAIESSMEGADELDIVINIGIVKSNKWNMLRKEISDIITATPDRIHKIIIETHYLTDEEKTKASIIAMEEGADFIKTSTGFAPGGATVEDVRLIRRATRGKIGIKAAGGVRRLKDVLSFVNAGATRIGTSSGVDIMREFK